MPIVSKTSASFVTRVLKGENPIQSKYHSYVHTFANDLPFILNTSITNDETEVKDIPESTDLEYEQELIEDDD